MKRAIVVGTGAGGATAAKELQGAFDVTILEAGGDFRPFSRDLAALARLRTTGLFLDERLIRLLFPAMRVRKLRDGMVLINGIGTGGTTTLATGNAMPVDADLKALGIDLDPEFRELERQIPITTDHQARWREITRRLFAICEDMGLQPAPLPKMGDYARCIRCGRCILGCPQGVKWDSRRFLDVALERGAQLERRCAVESVVIRGGEAVGIRARQGWRTRFYPADLVVLAAGGLGTPAILDRSGITCEPRLFVDPVLCVAAEWPGARLDREIAMPFVVERDRYIIAPYLDYLSFFFDRRWRLDAGDIVALMIKLADVESGSVTARGVEKELTDADRACLGEGVAVSTQILGRLGVPPGKAFLGTLNAGHPGGALPLTGREDPPFHDARLPANLYVADATLFPRSLGKPPILTIMAMAARVARICRETCA